MTIVLVRHGQTPGNKARIVQLPETPLNEVGMQQAERVAPRLAALSPAAILCSDLPRARMTVEPLLRLTGMQAEYDSLLQERNFGDLRGLPYSTFPEGHPFGAALVPPHGETWEAFHARVDRAFARVVGRRAELDGPLVVITHGLVLGSICARLVPNGRPMVPNSFHNTSVTVLDAEPPHTVRLLDDTAHLPVVTEVGAA